MGKLAITIVEGNEAYSFLADRTAHYYGEMLADHPELDSDGMGNCWVVAAVAHGVAQALGHKAQLCGGRVYNADTGDALFGGDNHYWVVVDGGTIIESPNPSTIMVHHEGQIEDLKRKKVAGKGHHLKQLSRAVRDRVLK